MSDNWVVQNLQNALDTWNSKLAEIWQILTQSPETFKGGGIWQVIVQIHGALQAMHRWLKQWAEKWFVLLQEAGTTSMQWIW